MDFMTAMTASASAMLPSSLLWKREIDPNLIAAGLPPRSSWLQNLALAIEIFAPSLATIVFGLRVYSRVSTKNLGWGATCLNPQLQRTTG